MMTAEFMLSKRPIARITAASSFSLSILLWLFLLRKSQLMKLLKLEQKKGFVLNRQLCECWLDPCSLGLARRYFA